MKLRVHIDSRFGINDDNVFIEIDVDFIPNKGDLLYLSNEHLQKLIDKVKINPDLYYIYDKWFYYETRQKLNNNEKITRKMFNNDFVLDDAIFVITRAISWDSKKMKFMNYIVLGDRSETD